MLHLIQHFLHHTTQRFSACLLCEVDAVQQHQLCQNCWQHLPWTQDRPQQRHNLHIYSACDYRYPIDRIIQQFKYEQKLHYQYLLAGLLTELRLPRFQAIVPMPISEKRLVERGYNQALILANSLSQHLNIPVWQPIQRQVQHSQKGLNRLERLENIEQQFEIIQPQKTRFKRVLIVDDVVTTGSSAHALATTLQQLGCEKIDVACLALA